MTDMVLRKFVVSEASNILVFIEGRNPGLISWLLVLMGLEDKTSFICTTNRIIYRESSVFGTRSITIPLHAVTSISSSVRKPKALLFLGIGVLLSSIWGAFQVVRGEEFVVGAGVIFFIIMLVAYILKKSIGIFVQNGGDDGYGLQFKASVVEGVRADFDSTTQAVEIINKAIVNGGRANSVSID